MGKVIIYLNMSLDSVVSDVEKWANINDAILKDSITRYEEIDAAIFGGATYEGMVAYWPKAEQSSKSATERKLAQMLNDKRKIIITKKNMELTWRNAEQWLIKTNKELVEKIKHLQNSKDGDIAVEAGLRTWRKFLKLGIFDGLELIVHPVIIGKGDKLFDGLSEKTPLKLVKTESFTGGGGKADL